jgi:hypothetical protein
MESEAYSKIGVSSMGPSFTTIVTRIAFTRSTGRAIEESEDKFNVE